MIQVIKELASQRGEIGMQMGKEVGCKWDKTKRQEWEERRKGTGGARKEGGVNYC